MPEKQGVIQRLVDWQNGQPISQETSIKSPDYRRFIVLEMAGRPFEIAVIERHDTSKTQAFIDFRIERGSFKEVVTTIKRRNATIKRKGGLF